MDKNNYFSSAIVTFPSEGDYKLWSEKFALFNTDQAKEITNDLQHCKTIADNNTNFLSNIIFWIGSVDADTEHQSIYRKCLKNRGHSVLN